eukprot:2065580-Pleurochrysis_carterae.AAC.1
MEAVNSANGIHIQNKVIVDLTAIFPLKGMKICPKNGKDRKYERQWRQRRSSSRVATLTAPRRRTAGCAFFCG